MDAAHRQRVEANLFWAARPAVEPWDEFPWHTSGGVCDSDKEHSSQALAIDVFGTLKVSPLRDIILNALARQLRLLSAGAWTVDLEWMDNGNVLRELRKTQVDAMARNNQNIIFFECKFTEANGGSCSQPLPLSSGGHKGKRQCNGHYQMQTNPVSGKTSRCALTAKGIRYWEVIPHIFDYQADVDYSPCPFAGPWFQWMRNLALCWQVAQSQNLQPAFVLVYADGPGLAVSAHVRSPEWKQFTAHLVPNAIAFRTISYQPLIALARTVVDDPLWLELSNWVEHKMTNVCRSHATSCEHAELM